ncbi:unnamed protein product [Ilex paraguariensis]|uniref:Cytochrome P450 n=1 Tax=Ilex paraguariensis TaxID=185542 RepID=A0ABC8UH82_9AQUA
MVLQLPSLPPLCAFFLFLLVVVEHKKRSNTQGPKLKLPPGPKKLPLIGNLHQLIGPLPHHTLRDLAKKHGPVMNLQLGEVSAVVISSPKAAREVMKTHDLIFASRPEILAFKIFSFNFMNMASVPYAFGIKCKDQDEFITTIQEVVKLAGGFDLLDVFPSLKFLHSINRVKPALEKMHPKIDKTLDNIIDDHTSRKAMIISSDKLSKEDLLDVLLKVQGKGDHEFPFPTDNLKSVILVCLENIFNISQQLEENSDTFGSHKMKPKKLF